MIKSVLAGTPLWVLVLFAYLVTRGIKARRPAQVSPAKLALFPLLLMAWCLFDLDRIHGLAAGIVVAWLTALAVGFCLGVALLHGWELRGDRARGLIHLPADKTLLPLILITFGVRYAFGVMAVMSLERLRMPLFSSLDAGSAGLFAGIFVGKFTVYMRAYLANDAAVAASGDQTHAERAL